MLPIVENLPHAIILKYRLFNIYQYACLLFHLDIFNILRYNCSNGTGWCDRVISCRKVLS